jgi:DNA-binding NarL/FixJ family response regulator
VAEAVDGVEAIALARRHRPAVVLMDIRMPTIDGLTATARVLALPEPPRVLVLTTFDRDDWVYEALRAGASGFLLKDVRGSQLTEAIRTVAAGEALLAPSVTRRLIEQFVSRAPERPPTSLPELTERERDVLRLLAGGLSNAEIAESLVIGHSTVKTHVNRLLTKLGLRDRAQAVVYAYESGFVRAGSG